MRFVVWVFFNSIFSPPKGEGANMVGLAEVDEKIVSYKPTELMSFKI